MPTEEPPLLSLVLSFPILILSFDRPPPPPPNPNPESNRIGTTIMTNWVQALTYYYKTSLILRVNVFVYDRFFFMGGGGGRIVWANLFFFHTNVVWPFFFGGGGRGFWLHILNGI